MTTRHTTVLAVLVAALLPVGDVSARFEYVTLDVPDAGGGTVRAYDIDGNNIVGTFSDPNHSHGFLHDGTDYITLDVPEAISTFPEGIDGNNIVGWSYNGSSNHGFLYDGTDYTTLDVPGAHKTFARHRRQQHRGGVLGRPQRKQPPRLPIQRHGLHHPGRAIVALDTRP